MVRIGIDVDDVLALTNDGFVPWFNEKHGTDFCKENIVSYNYDSFEGFDTKFVISELLYFTRYHMELFEVSKGAYDVLADLKKRGYELVILTARCFELKETTVAWLNSHFDEDFFDEILMYNSGVSDNICKSEICLSNDIDIMIEDAPHHIENIVALDIPVLAMDSPWNRKLEEGEYLKRVYTWDDVDKELEKIFLKV